MKNLVDPTTEADPKLTGVESRGQDCPGVIGPKKTATRRLHYVLSTHWDREWYQTFQDYRRRLVKLMDRVLDDLSGGKLKGPFTADGQAILLDDYLEIRPERRKQVEQLTAGGLLIVGPWYVLPDEFLVSGESLVRNLRLGKQIARAYGGEPSRAGFVCDLFGHTGQLPQILQGFGVRGGLIWRGLEARSSAHVLWKGSDGTTLPCYRFGRTGYCEFSIDVRRCQDADVSFERERAQADLLAFLTKEAKRTVIPPLLAFDGGDHLEYDADFYRTLIEDFEAIGFPGEIVHSTLDEYLEEMLQHADQISDVVEGELREPGRSQTDRQWLIPGVLSSRVWIKQANAKCQALLCSWAEPLASMASEFLGVEYPREYLDLAWRWLLMNHPHDSICGCSIDEVHEDMKYRFAQCRQIAAGQANESLELIARRIGGKCSEKEMRVVVANPVSRDVDEPIDLTLEIPAEWGTYHEFFGFEAKPAFRIYAANGSEVPYQLLALTMNRTKMRFQAVKYPKACKVHEAKVCLRLKLPALGYTTLCIREGEWSLEDRYNPPSILPTRHASHPGLATSERSMENEFIGVTIASNGTLNVTDKRTGHIYERLLTFEDCADIGDGWFQGPAVNDQRFFSSAVNAEIALVNDGPSQCRFRIRLALSLPREFNSAAGVRSEDTALLKIDTLVTLRAGCDRIEVCTTVDNGVMDHRLRVLFPTGAAANTYFSDAAFDVVERKIGLPEDNHKGRELQVETTPQQTWTAVSHEDRGLAIISTGLMESAVCDWPERPIALTLFRSTRRTVHTDGQPEGQIQGRMTFHYRILPLAGPPAFRRLFEEGILLAAGLRTVRLRHHDFPCNGQHEPLPQSASFLRVHGDLVLTSVRKIEGALEVRLFNPRFAETQGRLEFPGLPGKPHFGEVTRVDLESKVLGKSMKLGTSLPLTLKPKEIVTLRFSTSEASISQSPAVINLATP